MTAVWLTAVDVAEALLESGESKCRAYASVFKRRAERCEADGDSSAAEKWFLLWGLTQLRLDAGKADRPFGSFWSGMGSRSLVPVDLRGEKAEAVRELGLAVEDPELRARLLDVVWEANRDNAVVDSTVEAYLESGRRLVDPVHWVECVARFERALRLAVLVNRRELRDVVLSEIEDTVVSLDGEDEWFLSCRLVSLLLEFDVGDLETLSYLSDKGACNAEELRRFKQAEEHLRNLAKCCRKLGNEAGERSAMCRIARFLERDGRSELASGEYMRAAYWLEQAYVRYRQVPGMTDKAREVYELLREAQEGAIGSMKSVNVLDMDVTESVEQAQAAVSGYGFGEAFWRLLSMKLLVNFEDAERYVREMLDGAVWWRIASGSILDADGRVIARSSSDFDGGLGQADSPPWDHMASYVSLHQRMCGDVEVRSAMQQMMLEHVPVWWDVFEVVSSSPLVPFGHEGLFVEGVLSGLRGDMVHSLSVLVPQFENGLRELLRASGVEPSSMNKDGHQNLFQLGAMLSHPTLSDVLGLDQVKEMKVLFTDPHGSKLRDRLSHGMMSSTDFYSGAAWYAWWLICRVCFHPAVRRHLEASAASRCG